jgi:phosphoglycerate kinase
MANISTYNFEGKRALIRVDFNVPLDKESMEVTDDTRIRAAKKTIDYILNKGDSVVLMSHLGRPKSAADTQYSLKHIIGHAQLVLGHPIKFGGDCISEDAFGMSASLQKGEILLLENLRFYEEETKGDRAFAEKLAKHGDCYVNDAFGTAHRAHSSTSIIADFFPNDKMFGFLIESEIKSVDKVLNSTEKPLTAIVGGAKVSSKISIIEMLMGKVDNLIVGGGMAFTFVKAQGGKVGSSLIEDDYLDTAKRIIKMAKEKGVNLYIPVDAVIANKFSNDADTQEVNIREIPDGWMGLDAGTQTGKDCEEILAKSKLILWNGPMGVFEMSKFEEGTKTVALAIAKATENGAFSLIGGGDSVAAINQFHLADKVSYVSTGGGAMLEYLEGIELPGIAAINKA